jgi:hypothetical protein
MSFLTKILNPSQLSIHEAYNEWLDFDGMPTAHVDNIESSLKKDGLTVKRVVRGNLIMLNVIAKDYDTFAYALSKTSAFGDRKAIDRRFK